MSPVVAAFGGGVDSTAMLIGMVERGEPVDLILFADTGGEKPHTYEHVQRFSDWLVMQDYPAIVTVRAPNTTLEADVLKRQSLPSIAFGFKTCSQRFKTEPCDKYVRNWQTAKDAWARGEKLTKLIGYDVGEGHRAKDFNDDKWTVRYPLIEWGWDRQDAEEAIQRAGLPLPGKSACFFCPSSKKHEILELKKRYPSLMERALAMEANAELTAVKGLGRDFAWRDLIDFAERQLDMFPESRIEIDCGCYDG